MILSLNLRLRIQVILRMIGIDAKISNEFSPSRQHRERAQLVKVRSRKDPASYGKISEEPCRLKKDLGRTNSVKARSRKYPAG